MTSAVERIRQEANKLSYDEREALVRILEYDLDATSPKHEDPAAIEAAWDEEIAARVRDVEEGRVKLIPMAESDQQLDTLFAKHGVQRRPPRTA